MPIQQNRFHFGQERIMPVEVRPARLHHPSLRIGKVVDCAHQKIFRRSKVGVKNRNELALRRLHPFGERASLEARAVRPVVVADRMA